MTATSEFARRASMLNRFDHARLADIAPEREQRDRVARWTLLALSVQLASMDVAFAVYTAWHIRTDAYAATFRWFLVGTLGEIFAIMWVLVAYLFPKRRPSLYDGR